MTEKYRTSAQEAGCSSKGSKREWGRGLELDISEWTYRVGAKTIDWGEPGNGTTKREKYGDIDHLIKKRPSGDAGTSEELTQACETLDRTRRKCR